MCSAVFIDIFDRSSLCRLNTNETLKRTITLSHTIDDDVCENQRTICDIYTDEQTPGGETTRTNKDYINRTQHQKQ